MKSKQTLKDKKGIPCRSDEEMSLCVDVLTKRYSMQTKRSENILLLLIKSGNLDLDDQLWDLTP